MGNDGSKGQDITSPDKEILTSKSKQRPTSEGYNSGYSPNSATTVHRLARYTVNNHNDQQVIQSLPNTVDENNLDKVNRNSNPYSVSSIHIFPFTRSQSSESSRTYLPKNEESRGSTSSYILPVSSEPISFQTFGHIQQNKTSRFRQHLRSRITPHREKHLGLWNVGNTCYSNSVIQALYHCPLFRDCCQSELLSSSPDGLLIVLAQLFEHMNHLKRNKKATYVDPSKFIDRLKKKNEIFRSPEHHDAHEFFSYLANDIGEELLKRKSLICHNKVKGDTSISTISSTLINDVSLQRHHKDNDVNHLCSSRSNGENTLIINQSNESDHDTLDHLSAGNDSTPLRSIQSSPGVQTHCKWDTTPITPLTDMSPSMSSMIGLTPKHNVSQTTWLHELFQGTLVYETRCLCCENVTRRQEPFLDIPIDVECKNKDLMSCIERFANTEILRGKDKYRCDICDCLQEAERRLRFERLPRVLTFHLKRFKYDESIGHYSRVSNRVEFPLLLRFPTAALSQENIYFQSHNPPTFSTEVEDQASNPELQGPAFDLFGVVAHIGTSMSHGHYVACANSNGKWLLFDDHNVKCISEKDLETFFGSSNTIQSYKCGRTPFPVTLSTTNCHSNTHHHNQLQCSKRRNQLLHSLRGIVRYSSRDSFTEITTTKHITDIRTNDNQ